MKETKKDGLRGNGRDEQRAEEEKPEERKEVGSEEQHKGEKVIDLSGYKRRKRRNEG